MPHQAAALGDDEAELRSTIEKFRAEEIEHKDEALASGAEQAPAYEALTARHQGGLAAGDLAVDADLNGALGRSKRSAVA